VESVTNNIEVLPLSPFDDRIRLQVARALYGYNSPLFRYGVGSNAAVRILVKNGNVTLTGVVNSELDRTVANMRANQIPGVFSVTNNIVVSRS
jgi:hyperosmotically inducible periplasmic protein